MNSFDRIIARADQQELSRVRFNLVEARNEAREKLERSSGRPIAKSLHRRISSLRDRIVRIERALDSL